MKAWQGRLQRRNTKKLRENKRGTKTYVRTSDRSEDDGITYNASRYAPRSEVFTEGLMKIQVFWDVVLYLYLNNKPCFEEPWCLQLHRYFTDRPWRWRYNNPSKLLQLLPVDTTYRGSLCAYTWTNLFTCQSSHFYNTTGQNSYWKFITPRLSSSMYFMKPEHWG